MIGRGQRWLLAASWLALPWAFATAASAQGVRPWLGTPYDLPTLSQCAAELRAECDGRCATPERICGDGCEVRATLADHADFCDECRWLGENLGDGGTSDGEWHASRAEAVCGVAFLGVGSVASCYRQAFLCGQPSASPTRRNALNLEAVLRDGSCLDALEGCVVDRTPPPSIGCGVPSISLCAVGRRGSSTAVPILWGIAGLGLWLRRRRR